MIGGLTGLAVGRFLPLEYQTLTRSAIAIGTVAMGAKMFLQSKNILIPIGALIFGVAAGHLAGLQHGVEWVGDAAKDLFDPKSQTFQEAFVTPSLIYCVGPMTILGCLEDGLEGKVRLLALKSMLDGISSIFFAAALGPGVLLSAGTVLVVQIPLSLGASRLKGLVERVHVLDEISAAGGLILIVIGLNLLGIQKLPSADFLPALLFAGLLAKWFPPK